MNPFLRFEGLHLNGRFYSPKQLREEVKHPSHPAHFIEVLKFAISLFDESIHLSVSSSGSTGPPKELYFPKEAFLASATSTNAFFGMSRDSKALLSLPMRYIAGKMMLTRAVAGQYMLHVVEPAARPFEQSEESYQLVPLTPYQLARSLETHAEVLARQEALLIGGGAMGEELIEAALDEGLKLFASFGMSESLSHFAIARIEHPGAAPLYRPLKGVETRIDGQGQLHLRWNPIVKNWLPTRDIVQAAGEGFHWLGRMDHLINTGGVKVIPERLEARIAHLMRRPFFVGALPHPELGEQVVLFVEAEGLPANDLLRAVQMELRDEPHWQPRQLQLMEAFEYTLSGKIRRAASIEKWARQSGSR